MKATVIGANSYIARNLIYSLQMYGRCDELYLYDYQENQVDGIHPYEKVSVLDSLSAINFDVDCVYMFTGKTGSIDGFDNPDIFVDINEKSLLHVLNEYVSQKSHAKLIFPSTRLLYDHNPNAREKDVSNTLKTIYAVNKLACEKYIEMYHNVFGVEYVIIRICIPYGTIVPKASSYGTAEFMLSKAESGKNIILYGDGSTRRTLTYIGDLCRALICVAENDKCRNNTYNVGGENYSLTEMADVIAKSYGVGLEFVEYPSIAGKIESGDTVFNDEKLKNIIGEYSKVSFEYWVKHRHAV